jgi:antitoxin component of MazEF toxin-antitoxin module
MQSIGPNSTMSWNLLKILGSDTVVTCAVETAMRVSKRGNGLAVRLPKKLVEQFGIAAGDDVDITSPGRPNHRDLPKRRQRRFPDQASRGAKAQA